MKYEDFSQIKLVPVLRKIPYETSQQLIEALYLGGIGAVEVTMDTENAAAIIKEALHVYEGKMLVGAGTVLSLEDCIAAIEAGAQFIVSPSYNESVVVHCIAHDVVVIPGVFTPSEMQKAYEQGVKIVKLFPASTLGPSFIKNVKGPLTHIQIMATGGISIHNAQDYLQAGALAVGAGSDLLDKTFIANEDWNGLKEIAAKWVKACE